MLTEDFPGPVSDRARVRTVQTPGSSAWMAAPLLWVTLILFLRQAIFFIHPQFWAEDASVLFLQARTDGWHSLLLPHPTYYILAQRLIACLAASLPALYAPWIYCYAALVYALLAAWFCLRARLDSLVDRRGRIALALALVLVPHNGEVFMKLIGTQWILMSILLILIVQDAPATRGQAAVDFLGLLLAGLTGPFIVFYAPWFLVRLKNGAGRWSAYNLLLIGTAWGLAGLQYGTMRQGPPLGTFTHDPHQWMRQLGFMLPGGLFFGATVPHLIGPVFWVVSPLLLALAVWALWRGERKRLWAALTLFGCSGIAYVGGLQIVASAVGSLDPFGNGARYFYPFYVCSMWVGVIFCFDASSHLRAAARAALAMMLLASASYFRDPGWPNLHWATYAKAFDAGGPLYKVPVLPGWEVDFPPAK